MVRCDSACWSELVANATLHAMSTLHRTQIVVPSACYGREFGGMMPSTFRAPASTLREKRGCVCVPCATAKELFELQ
jgi:hypothetical protein